MAVESPVSHRNTVVALLLLTFATGLVDAVSVLVLGHVFVANMTGNVIFLGFWFVPQTGVDMTAAVVAFVCFVVGTVIGGRLARHLDHDDRRDRLRQSVSRRYRTARKAALRRGRRRAGHRVGRGRRGHERCDIRVRPKARRLA